MPIFSWQLSFYFIFSESYLILFWVVHQRNMTNTVSETPASLVSGYLGHVCLLQIRRKLLNHWSRTHHRRHETTPHHSMSMKNRCHAGAIVKGTRKNCNESSMNIYNSKLIHKLMVLDAINKRYYLWYCSQSEIAQDMVCTV